MLYVKATNNPALFKLFPVETPSDTVQARYMVELGRSLGVARARRRRRRRGRRSCRCTSRRTAR